MRAGVLVRLEFPHTERRALVRCGLVECSRDDLTSPDGDFCIPAQLLLATKNREFRQALYKLHP